MAKDYYDILGVSKGSSKEEIKSAYKKLAKKYHPDVNKEEGSEDKLKEITQAYSILSDDQKRAQYDRFGADASNYGSSGFSSRGFSFDFSDLFSDFDTDFFSNFGGFRSSKRDEWQNLDIKTRIDLDFISAAKGTKKTINLTKEVICDFCNGTGSKSGKKTTCPECGGRGSTVTRKQTPFGLFAVQQTCHRCHGTGKIITDECKKCSGKGYVKQTSTISVDIPAGINNGDYLRLRNQGNERVDKKGDLFILISVANHEFFKRSGADLYCEVPLTYSDLVLGTKITIKGIQDTINLKVPSETTPGTIFNVKGKGLSDPNRRGVHGSLFVKVTLAMPTNVNKDYKEFLSKINSIDDKSTKKKIQQKLKEYISF